MMQSYLRMWNLAKFELVRLFLTKRGIIALAAFATVWFIILRYFVSSAVSIVSSHEFEQLAAQFFGAMGLSELLTWPVAELAIYWLVAAFLFPCFVLVVSADQTCSDRTRGTLRFILLRATRTEILFGRFFGQFLIITLLIMITLFATMLMAVYRDFSLWAIALAKSLLLLGNLTVIVTPFIAFMAFLNSFLRSSKLAMVVCTLFFGLGPLVISLFAYQFSLVEYLNYAIPGIQITQVLVPSKMSVSLYLLPLFQSVLYLLIAQMIMKRGAL